MKEACQCLKVKLTTPSVLAFSGIERPFIVDTNASFLSLGSVLGQKKKGGKVHPAQLASRTMSISEKNYTTCEREASAVMLASKIFRVYIVSSILFTVVTDHQAFRYTFQKKNVHGRLARWLNFLAEYGFKIEHRPGKRNAPVDYLSRLDLRRSTEQGCNEGDLACTTASTEDFSVLQHHLLYTAAYLSDVSLDHLGSETCRKTRRNSKRFAVWQGSLFCEVRNSLRLIPQKHLKDLIQNSYRDDTGHPDRKATLNLIRNRF